MNVLEQLNSSQQDAVISQHKYNLILAGAGSGKTRVLTSRISYLLQQKKTHPLSVFAVTFTNKAAKEMKDRIYAQIGGQPAVMWIGTFHSLALRILRSHWQTANLKQNFQILDSQDQTRMVKRIITDLNLNDKIFQARYATNFINDYKEEGKRAKDIKDSDNISFKEYIKIYQRYEDSCQEAGLVDFGEILLRTLQTLKNNPDILQHYQQRFSHILVDEFQDTNKIQYNWIKQLAGEKNNVFAVGDDDQSIYGWRGAKIENILNFNKDFQGTNTTRLEQNYRSCSNILDAANALISKNTGRMGKNLWTKIGTGEKIDLFVGLNEYEEAEFVVNKIQEYQKNKDFKLEDVAILYRTNVQSRIFEEVLIRYKIPYHIYGGLRFFEREEIKDVLAYLRLIANQNEDIAYSRIINRPARGIGKITQQQIADFAKNNSVSLFVATKKMLLGCNNFSTKAKNSLVKFTKMIDGFSILSKKIDLVDLFKDVLSESGLLDLYNQDKSEKGKTKTDNLKDFVNTGGDIFIFEEEIPEKSEQLLSFLNHISLEQGEKNNSAEDNIQMMSLHSAKGLEFPIVFMVGMEENIFPTSRSIETHSKLEEERRLCYVGITRAKEKLHLCLADSRQLYGKTNYNLPSRFIKEIPQKYITNKSIDINANLKEEQIEDEINLNNKTLPYTFGSRVSHPKFGEGIVTDFAGSGSHKRVQVTFSTSVKWLSMLHAKLIVL
jgi:DNA helicase II / ATP-dependent DNA helicase PcrA